jgi:prepilin signal peptidase PulO-like enzyme (type II secretory pathway)
MLPALALRLILLPALLAACALWDIRTRSIPDALTWGGTAALVLLSFLTSPAAGVLSVAAAATGFGVFLLVRALTRGKLGGGDVKLSMLIGAGLGPLGWYIAVSVSVAAAILYALATGRRRRAVIFGPFLAVGGALVLAILALFPALPLRPF